MKTRFYSVPVPLAAFRGRVEAAVTTWGQEMQRKFKQTTNINLRLPSQSFNMDRNEPFLGGLSASWGWMGGVNSHFREETKAKRKNSAGLLKESALISEHIPNGRCQWDMEDIQCRDYI